MLLHADSEDLSDWADAQADLCWVHKSFSWFCHVATIILERDSPVKSTSPPSSKASGLVISAILNLRSFFNTLLISFV